MGPSSRFAGDRPPVDNSEARRTWRTTWWQAVPWALATPERHLAATSGTLLRRGDAYKFGWGGLPGSSACYRSFFTC